MVYTVNNITYLKYIFTFTHLMNNVTLLLSLGQCKQQKSQWKYDPHLPIKSSTSFLSTLTVFECQASMM